MSEYRTKPLIPSLLMAELAAVCEALSNEGVELATVSFGWDSNLPIEEMWKDQQMPVKDISTFVSKSEGARVVEIGKADIFVESPGILFTLCHEGDAHVKGESPLVKQITARWQSLEYEPYELPASA